MLILTSPEPSFAGSPHYTYGCYIPPHPTPVNSVNVTRRIPFCASSSNRSSEIPVDNFSSLRSRPSGTSMRS